MTQATGPVSSLILHSDVHFFPLDPVHHPDLRIPSLQLQTAACKLACTYTVLGWSWIFFFLRQLLFFLNQIVTSMTTDTHFYAFISPIVPSAIWRLCILINKYSLWDIWFIPSILILTHYVTMDRPCKLNLRACFIFH